MADLDQLLRGDIAQSAADAASMPDLAILERRGVRRRRTHSAATGLSTAAAVLAIGLAALQFGGDDRTTPPVTPTRTPTPSAEAPTADQIVDDPSAVVAAVVVAPENPRIRAVVWRLCKNERCSRMHEAVAVTDDGFRTRATVIINDFPTYVGHGVFSFGFGNPRLLRTDGSVLDVVGARSDPGPVGPGEVVVSYGSGILRWTAVDPATGHAHTLPVPDDITPVVRLGPGGRLSAEGFGAAAYNWSDDGGSTWSSTELDTDGQRLTVLAASREGDPVAVLEGGDGATLFPLDAVHRSIDGGRTFERIPLFDDPMAYGQNAGVLPDGRLLVNIEAWSDSELGGVHQRPVGLHISSGSDWSDLQPLESARQYPESQPDVFATRDGLLIVYGREGVASTDGGRTWQELALR